MKDHAVLGHNGSIDLLIGGDQTNHGNKMMFPTNTDSRGTRAHHAAGDVVGHYAEGERVALRRGGQAYYNGGQQGGYNDDEDDDGYDAPQQSKADQRAQAQSDMQGSGMRRGQIRRALRKQGLSRRQVRKDNKAQAAANGAPQTSWWDKAMNIGNKIAGAANTASGMYNQAKGAYDAFKPQAQKAFNSARGAVDKYAGNTSVGRHLKHGFDKAGQYADQFDSGVNKVHGHAQQAGKYYNQAKDGFGEFGNAAHNYMKQHSSRNQQQDDSDDDQGDQSDQGGDDDSDNGYYTGGNVRYNHAIGDVAMNHQLPYQGSGYGTYYGPGSGSNTWSNSGGNYIGTGSDGQQHVMGLSRDQQLRNQKNQADWAAMGGATGHADGDTVMGCPNPRSKKHMMGYPNPKAKTKQHLLGAPGRVMRADGGQPDDDSDQDSGSAPAPMGMPNPNSHQGMPGGGGQGQGGFHGGQHSHNGFHGGHHGGFHGGFHGGNRGQGGMHHGMPGGRHQTQQQGGGDDDSGDDSDSSSSQGQFSRMKNMLHVPSSVRNGVGGAPQQGGQQPGQPAQAAAQAPQARDDHYGGPMRSDFIHAGMSRREKRQGRRAFRQARRNNRTSHGGGFTAGMGAIANTTGNIANIVGKFI